MHGIDSQVYALVSSASTQINARFVFLSSGRCPSLDGAAAATACWSHPGSYLGAVAVQQLRANGGGVSRLAMLAGAADEGFVSVELDGVFVSVDATAGETSDDFYSNYEDRHTVMVSTADFTFRLQSSDRFINILQVAARRPITHIQAHGLLGQTTSGKLHQSRLRVIEGDVDDYAIDSNELFASDFAYNRFGQPNAGNK